MNLLAVDWVCIYANGKCVLMTFGVLARSVPEQQLVPPRFTKNLENVVAADGREVTLSCVVTGTPTPEVSWFHNHKNIDASEDFVINYDRTTGRVELVIVDCLPDDQVLQRLL